MSNVKRKNNFTIQVEKASVDINKNESISNLKHQNFYPRETTVIVGDSIINGEREIDLLQYATFQELQ